MPGPSLHAGCYTDRGYRGARVNTPVHSRDHRPYNHRPRILVATIARLQLTSVSCRTGMLRSRKDLFSEFVAPFLGRRHNGPTRFLAAGRREEHADKLRRDQLAAKAQHAILSTHKFPRDARQLDQRDGVILANPARVVSVATIIREHLVQLHTLRLSKVEQEQKTADLLDQKQRNCYHTIFEKTGL